MKNENCEICGRIKVYDDAYGTEVCPYCKNPHNKKAQKQTFYIVLNKKDLKSLIAKADKKSIESRGKKSNASCLVLHFNEVDKVKYAGQLKIIKVL